MISASSAFTTANADLVKSPILLLEIDGYSRVFTNQDTGISGQYDWMTAVDDLSVTISDLDGGADQAQLSVTVQDHGQAITADFPNFIFEGKTVTLKTGYSSMEQTDFCLLFTGVVDHVESTNGNQEYVFVCVDNRELLNEVVYATGDDGQPTDNDHPHTLLAHPLDILIDVLETEIGIASSLVDETTIHNLRDDVYSGLVFSFSLTSAPTAKDFIEQELLKPLGAYLWTNNQGKFTVNAFYHSDTTPVITLTEDDTADEIPDVMQADLINVVTVRFDKETSSGSDKFLVEVNELDGDSVDKYGQFGQQIIESQGMRSAFQGVTQAKVLARNIFLRYGNKTQKLEDMAFLWSACVLEPGDIIALTNQYIPDRTAGTVGITAKLFEVLDRTWDFTAYTVKLTLLDASYLASFGTFEITPDDEADFASASAADKKTYMFLCDEYDVYSDDTAGHALG